MMFDITRFFSQDRVSVVVEPVFETTDVFLWDWWACSNLRMLDNEFI